MIIEYKQEIKSVFKILDNEKYIVLATASKDRVTARIISHIILNDLIYFQTDSNFLKTKQIKQNKKVALCLNNIQIEGEATICAHPYDNEEFIEKFKTKHKDSYKQYSNLKDEITIQIKPTFITIWEYKEGKPLRKFLNILKNEATFEYYEPKRK